MPLPYAFIRGFSGECNPNPKLPCSYPKDKMNYLMKEQHMKGLFLGACLDSCRWGSHITVMWETDVYGMIHFIQNWMEQNRDNFPALFHERKISELYTHFELPYIDRKTCPVGKDHSAKIKDVKGRIRCADRKIRLFKPSFICSYEGSTDDFSQIRRWNFLHNSPSPLPDEAYDDAGNVEPDYEDDSRKIEEFEEEEENEPVLDVCYAIISDTDLVLPLETVIRRLNLAPETQRIYCKGPDFSFSIECRPERIAAMTREEKENYEISPHCSGHERKTNQSVFPFDGWDFALYVQRWYEQKGRLKGGMPPFFEKGTEKITA